MNSQSRTASSLAECMLRKIQTIRPKTFRVLRCLPEFEDSCFRQWHYYQIVRSYLREVICHLRTFAAAPDHELAGCSLLRIILLLFVRAFNVAAPVIGPFASQPGLQTLHWYRQDFRPGWRQDRKEVDVLALASQTHTKHHANFGARSSLPMQEERDIRFRYGLRRGLTQEIQVGRQQNGRYFGRGNKTPETLYICQTNCVDRIIHGRYSEIYSAPGNLPKPAPCFAHRFAVNRIGL